MFALTGWLVYVLTRDMFGAGAGLIALFALNVTPFFFASAGGWIVPDGPLLAALAAAALALARLIFGAPPGRREAWMLWLAAGAGFGLAGLSKYSAALNALGLVAFHRAVAAPASLVRRSRALRRRVVALALQAPTMIWNAENDWISLSFQAARGAPDRHSGLAHALASALGQIALSDPLGVCGPRPRRRRGLSEPRGAATSAGCSWSRSPRRRSLFFTLTPIWGDRGLPHWAMPGWFFLYPLLGAALAGPPPVRGELGGVEARHRALALPSPASSGEALRRWAIGSAAFLAVLVALVVAQADFGVAQRLLGRSFRDPTLESLDWRELKAAIGEAEAGLSSSSPAGGRPARRRRARAREHRSSSFPTIRAASRSSTTARASSAATRDLVVERDADRSG